VALVGFMGSGKSAVGKALAELTGTRCVDTDSAVEEEAGIPIATIFERQGEARFRALERRVVRWATGLRNTVISLGGGALLDSRNLANLRESCLIVWLRARPETLLARLEQDHASANRPLFNGHCDPESFAQFVRERSVQYAQAHAVLDIDDLTPVQAAQRLREIWKRKSPASPGVRGALGAGVNSTGGVRVEVPVDVSGGKYSVLIGSGLVDVAGRLRPGGRPVSDLGARALVVSSCSVAALFGAPLETSLEAAGLHCGRLRVPDGEGAKSLSVLGDLCERAAERGFGRDTVVFALGGGTVGDVVGIFASTYMRGVPLVQVPTTLLSMVDSSVGGKTAVNLRAGKNLMGTFYQPSAVICDVATLGTLPVREVRNGLAEVVKSAVIGDPSLFEFIEARAASLDSDDPYAVCSLVDDETSAVRIVSASLGVKIPIVQDDVADRGTRMLLNLGHTLGHAVEREGRYRQWTHGEAVSIGLAAACRASRDLGMMPAREADRVIALLERLGLPVSLERRRFRSPEMKARLAAHMGLDKKALTGRFRIVLLRGIGRCTVSEDHPPTVLIDAAEGLAQESAGKRGGARN
jgi:3-dehydroquinate synthase